MKISLPGKPNVCGRSAHAFFRLENVKQIPYRQLVAGIYVTKIVTKCLHFVYFFSDLLIVKCLTKFSILAVKCLANCLL
jgi:hypothetical protein